MKVVRSVAQLVAWLIIFAAHATKAEADQLDSYTAQTRQKTDLWNAKIAVLIARQRILSAITAIGKDESCHISRGEPPTGESSAAADWAKRSLNAALNCRYYDRRWQFRLSTEVDYYEKLSGQANIEVDHDLVETASKIVDNLQEHSRLYRLIIDRLNGKVISCTYINEYGAVDRTTTKAIIALRHAIRANDAYLARTAYNEIVISSIERYVDAEACGSAQADEVAQKWIEAASYAEQIAEERSVNELIADACKSLPNNLVPAEACGGAPPTVEMEYAVHSALKLAQGGDRR